MYAHNKELKAFLMKHMYRHYRVNRMSSKARRVMKELFAIFHAEPETLPTAWRMQVDKAGSYQCAVVVADFIASMTDRFAIEEHRRLYDLSATT